MRNIIQVGLYKWAEWAYLTQNDWTTLMPDLKKTHHLPAFYMDNPEPFRYFGVDVSPSSIKHCQEVYKDYQNTYFIACGIGENFSVENVQNRNYSKETTGAWYDYIDEKYNTLFVFAPFSFILHNLGIQDVAVLALDIDGYEVELLSDIKNWEIKPELISLEMSIDYPIRTEYQLLINEGYIHIRTTPQYTPEEVAVGIEKYGIDVKSNHEEHFLRNDIYEKHKDTIQIEHVYYPGGEG